MYNIYQDRYLNDTLIYGPIKNIKKNRVDLKFSKHFYLSSKRESVLGQTKTKGNKT